MRNPHPGSERGASAILVAVAMVVLMGFAAVAVDSGVAFDDRRQQQSAADTGVLAALQFAKTSLSSSNATCNAQTGADYAACRGAEEAIEVVEGNLPGRYTWNGVDGEWDSCTDGAKPAEYSQTSHLSDCISFTASLQKARLVLPGTAVQTTFGWIVGRDTINVSAVAEGKLDLSTSAEILPFAVGPTGAGSDHACLFANAQITLDVEPCDGPEEGNFGFLDISLYGNLSLGTDTVCGNAFTTSKLAANIIVGSDHPIEEQWQLPGVVNDFTNCNNIANPVDQVHTWTGNATPGLEAGLFDGSGAHLSSTLEGRLMCKDGDSTEPDWAGFDSNDCVNVWNGYPEKMDNTPLWDYITDDAKANGAVVGNACQNVTNRSEMQTCIANWKVTLDPPQLFTIEITESPRFAALPILDGDPSNGTGAYLIENFVPAYIETIFVQCTAFSCDFAHSPGEASNGPMCPNPMTGSDSSCGWPATGMGQKNITALSSFILSIDMLDSEHQKFFPGRPGTVVYNLFD